jgi:ribonucleotide monophosphatase NagD (HAD superfamily)
MFVLDMWGVMHDGSRPYDGALEAIQMLVQRGKRIVILSNSSKRQDHSIKMLRKLGFDPRDFDMIITSGEVAHQMLSGQGEWLEPCRPWKPLRDLAERDCGVPKKAFCLGSGDGDDVYLRSCGWTLAPPDAADLVVARGTFTVDDGQSAVRKRDNPQWYESELRRTLAIAARRRLPMIVCNPDKVRPDADRPPMPGKIGDLYEEILVNLWGTSLTGDGEELCELVKRVGKPDRDVFDIALTTTALKSKASNRRDLAPTTTTSSSKKAPLTLRACMVGDALETDVVGGSAAGLDTIWVLETGIHGPDLLTRPSSSSPLTAKKAAAQAVLDDFNRQDGTYARGRLLAAAVLIPSFRW